MARRERFLAAILAGLIATAAGGDQPPLPASLVADSVSYDRTAGLLVATGHVQVLYQGRVLTAEKITYDEHAQEIRAEGPLQLTDPSGGVILADSAALTPDLKNGLIESARLLIAGKMQLAAAEARRSDGRYSTLYRTVASSCTICAGNPTPTWALRASRVTQDEAQQRLYFEDATLQLFGLPVAYLPQLSIPSPGVDRASGVLVPRVQQSSIYGVGVKVPYYRVISPSADATITPFFTTTGAKLFEGGYRQRFTNGGFDFSGVVALDDGMGGTFGRGAAFMDGRFALGDGFFTDFNLALTSDNTFLQQFDYSDTDLLTSTARVVRSRQQDYFELGTVAFQSLRDEPDTGTVPYILPDFFYRRLIDTPLIGGHLGLQANTLGVLHEAGQGTFRVGGGIDWQNDWTLARGVRASAGAATDLEAYQVWDDPTSPDGLLVRGNPTIDAELRWPWARPGSTGATQVIEPIVQVVYSHVLGEADVPNNDSQLVEFDTTNLFSVSRFPGEDRVETGLRANVGINYVRYDPAGWSMGAAVGQVIRANQDPAFPPGSGLGGQWSDYVAAVQLNFASGLGLLNRSLFGTDFVFDRNELAVNYQSERAGFQAAYVYLAANNDNPFVGPQPETNEIGLDARYRVRPNWEVSGLWQYDLSNGNNLRTGAGIAYGNECAEFDLSVSRRYTSSNNLPPGTSLGFQLRLAGLGSGQRNWPGRVCSLQGT